MRAQAVLWMALALGCAGGGAANVSRTYERPELRQLRLQDLDVVVVAAPVATSGPVLSVPTFAAPALAEPVRIDSVDQGTEQALRGALASWLGAAGFRPKFLGAPPALVAPLAPASTSTTVVQTSSVVRAMPAPAPEPAPTSGPEPMATLDAILGASTADAVLVVRVVPVDAFYVFGTGGSKATAVDLSDGTVSRIQAEKPELRSGRLLVGQAFLFDRVSKLRLWSRQLPEFPNAGRLADDDPFLRYGVVTDPARSPELSPSERAQKAASNFTKAMFASFPPANASEQPAARAQVNAIDLAADVTREETLDDRETGVELHLGYGGESIGTAVTLDGVALPDLSTGAIAPSGVLRLGLGARHRAPGGFTVSGVAFFGRAPGEFARAYYQDGPNPTGTSNRTAIVSLERVQLYGAEARGGYSLLLTDALTLVPSAGLYFEAWSLKVTPTVVVPDDLHLRLGVVIGADLLYRLGQDSGWYLRGGPLLRVGLDFAGPAYVGGGLDVGVGVRL